MALASPLEFDALIAEIGEAVAKDFGKGQVAQYIPALRNVAPRRFGMAVFTVDGKSALYGDADVPFSIQSISKVLTLIQALGHVGSELWRRVGREPSGTRFNTLSQLEEEKGFPRNPFVNAGALVVTDCVASHDAMPVRSLVSLARRLSRNDAIQFDREVARSEEQTGHVNAAIAHLLKSYGNLMAPVEQVLRLYFHQCALAMSCVDLARAFLPLANQGVCPETGVRFLDPRRVKRINALMLTCGLYDGVGNFAYRVGIPAKSGVGGGIVGVIPRHLSVCVWSPELDAQGNSYVGTKALELFTTKTRLSIFCGPGLTRVQGWGPHGASCSSWFS